MVFALLLSAGCSGPGAPGSADAVPSRPTADASPPIASRPADAGDPASLAYLLSEFRPPGAPRPESLELTVVDGTGSAVWEQSVPLDPAQADGGLTFATAALGRVAWAGPDGIVKVASVPSGEVTSFPMGDAGIGDGTFDRSGEALLLILGSGDDRQLVRMPLATGVPEPITTSLPALAPAEFHAALRTTPDGTRAVAVTCSGSGESCRYSVLTLATGAVRELALEQTGMIAGLGDSVMLVFEATGCTPACTYQTLDLETGDAAAFDAKGGTWDPIVAKTEAGDDVIVFSPWPTADDPTRRIVMRDAATGAESVLTEREPDSDDHVVDPWGWWLHAPVGTVAVAPHGELALGPDLIRLADGAVTPLEPADRH